MTLLDFARVWLLGALATWGLMVALHSYNRETPGKAAVAAFLLWPILLPINLLIIALILFTFAVAHTFGLDSKPLVDWWRDE